MKSFFVEFSFRVRHGAPKVRSLRKFRANLYRSKPLPAAPGMNKKSARKIHQGGALFCVLSIVRYALSVVSVTKITFHLRVLGGFPSEPLPVGASDLDFPTPFTRGDSPFAPSIALNLPPTLGLIFGSAGGSSEEFRMAQATASKIDANVSGGFSFYEQMRMKPKQGLVSTAPNEMKRVPVASGSSWDISWMSGRAGDMGVHACRERNISTLSCAA